MRGRSNPEAFTSPLTEELGANGALAVRRFRLEHGKKSWESKGDRSSIGSHASNDVVIDDTALSRFHCEIVVGARGALVRDLGSRNGTTVDGVRVVEAFLRDGSMLGIGRSTVRFGLCDERNPVPMSENDRFGTLIGGSAAMRATFALLERASATDFTVLLEGETGTGKEAAAESVHEASGRRRKPFVVVDCSALPKDLLESELFGHERGAFTGATASRLGAFEEAAGGTVFLDEIGEMPLELQPKLLRVLEKKSVRRVGSNAQRPIDVRVVAATNRDLRGETNAGRFRADLYFRLAVVRITLPALRQRPDDIPMLLDHLLGLCGATADDRKALEEPAFVDQLRAYTWPGNVRELRNYVQRCVALRGPIEIEGAPRPAAPLDPNMPYDDARQAALADFERRYVRDLLQRHGTVTAAARAAGIARVYLHRLIRRHGLQQE
jgi:DNA-binding NtrC family response regulator